jgi:hypothetical protein
LTAGQATGRQPRWHPPDWAILTEALHTVAHLFVTEGDLPSIELPLIDPGSITQLVAVAALLVAVVRADRRHMPPIVAIGLIYAGLYCAFLLLTVSLFDAGTPVDVRLLVPIVPSIVFTIAWLTKQTPITAVAIFCVFAVATLQQARTVSLYGLDYSGRIWSAGSFERVSLRPGDLRSNWPAAVAYFTNRSPGQMPQRFDPHTLDTNPHYARDLRDLAQAVRNGRTTLVILDNAFLQLPARETPLPQTALFRKHCRAVTKIVTICGTQR